MKRNITLSSISKMVSLSMAGEVIGTDVAFLSRCRQFSLGIWNRQDLTLEHPEPLDYTPIDRSGWPQLLSCYAPN